MANHFSQLTEAVIAKLAADVARHLVDVEFATPEQGGPVLAEMISQAVDGGKRLRSALVEAAYRSVDPDPVTLPLEQLAQLAGAIEVFHCSALIHDDLIDHAATRRGHASVQVLLADTGHHEGWRPPKRDLPEGLTIIIGDLLLVEAERLAHQATDSAPRQLRRALLNLLDQMRREVIAGQFLDTLAPALPFGLPQADLAAAWRVLRAKSANYSVRYPVLIGATAAGASARQLKYLSQYGLAIGEAFQLRDDLLGVYGDPAKTGKPVGSDLIEGKRTVLLALARAEAQPQHRQRIQHLVQAAASAVDPTELAELTKLINQSGAPRMVETLIWQRHEAAVTALKRAELVAPSPLLDLAWRLTERKS